MCVGYGGKKEGSKKRHQGLIEIGGRNILLKASITGLQSARNGTSPYFLEPRVYSRFLAKRTSSYGEKAQLVVRTLSDDHSWAPAAVAAKKRPGLTPTDPSGVRVNSSQALCGATLLTLLGGAKNESNIDDDCFQVKRARGHVDSEPPP